MKRKEFTRRVKLAAWDRCRETSIDGTPRCEGRVGQFYERCSLPLRVGHITYDHVIPCEEGGDNSLDNCQVLGPCCDKPKTARDQTTIAHSRAIRARHVGAHKPKRPMPGSKASGLRKRMDGTVERRGG